MAWQASRPAPGETNQAFLWKPHAHKYLVPAPSMLSWEFWSKENSQEPPGEGKHDPISMNECTCWHRPGEPLDHSKPPKDKQQVKQRAKGKQQGRSR